MKKSRFSETQISQALREHEANKKASYICRELTILFVEAKEIEESGKSSIQEKSRTHSR